MIYENIVAGYITSFFMLQIYAMLPTNNDIMSQFVDKKLLDCCIVRPEYVALPIKIISYGN